MALTVGTAMPGAALTTANLRSVLTEPVTVDAGALGSATWSGGDWDTPFKTWVSGPAMSSWIYRKPVGTDPTLVAWLEVRLYATGAVDVLPWVENGYVLVGGHTNKNTTWAFWLGGTRRISVAFDLPARSRAVLVTGRQLSHWLGTDPGLTVRHDASYLMGTRMVPKYGASSPDSAVAAWSDTIGLPQEQGMYPNGMGQPGYHLSIGLLPQWDAMYLTNGSAKVWRIVQQQAYRAGRYGIYFRDENDSNRPVRPSQHLWRVFNVSNIGDSGASYSNEYPSGQTGTLPAVWKTSHHPSTGYLAALVTGRFFHVETTQFVTALNMLHAQYRNADGVTPSNPGTTLIFVAKSHLQPRGFGWALRSLAQSTALAPDGDAWKTELQGIMDRTIAYNHALEVANAKSRNPLGWIDAAQPSGPDAGDYTPGVDPGVRAVWMHDFITASMGYMLAIHGTSIAEPAKLSAWFSKLAGTVVNRFGGTGATEWLYRDACPYVCAYTPTDSPDWITGAGPWYANWGEAYAATYINSSFDADNAHTDAAPYTRVKTIGDGTLRGGAIGNSGSYWANMQPALAYCVLHSVPGAAAAWSRLVGAPNYASGVESFFSAAPEWGVYPGA